MKACSKDLVLDEKGALLPHHSNHTGVGEKGLNKDPHWCRQTNPLCKEMQDDQGNMQNDCNSVRPQYCH